MPDTEQADIVISAVTVYEHHEVVWIVPRTGNGKKVGRQGRQDAAQARGPIFISVKVVLRLQSGPVPFPEITMCALSESGTGGVTRGNWHVGGWVGPPGAS